jgi:GNAT superfamily N-acetyltransferase
VNERVRVRTGDVKDAHAVIGLMDAAQQWLIANGRADQWGTTPFSSRPEQVQRMRALAAGGGLRIAEREGVAVGAIVLGPAPDFAPPADTELYLRWFVTDPEAPGIGAVLLAEVRAEAIRRGARVLRTDCWAGGDGALVRYYERAGFIPGERVRVGEWYGQILTYTV